MPPPDNAEITLVVPSVAALIEAITYDFGDGDDGPTTELLLDTFVVDDDEAAAIARALRRRTINVWGLGLRGLTGDGAVAAIAEAVKSTPTLARLSLVHSPHITDVGFSSIAVMMESCPWLAQLDMGSCDVTDTAAVRLGEALARSPWLTRLHLAQNRYIADAGAAALASALERPNSLVGLDLSSNSIGDMGASRLADAISSGNTSLARLDLIDNVISDVGASRLAEAAEQSTKLVELGLAHNAITDVGGLRLADAVRSAKSLAILQVDNNPISDVSVLALAGAMVLSRSVEGVFAPSLNTSRRSLKAMSRAQQVVGAIRLGLALLTGAPSSTTSACVLWRRFILDKDGDHAIWARVVEFLCEVEFHFEPVAPPDSDDEEGGFRGLEGEEDDDENEDEDEEDDDSDDPDDEESSLE